MNTQSDITDRSMWRGKSISERRRALKEVFVLHACAKRTVEWIEWEMKARLAEARANGALLICPSGAGKTALARYMARRYPDVVTDELTIRSVVYLNVPLSVTASSFGTALLDAIGDPLPTKGNAEVKLKRGIHLLNVCKARLIFVDNFQDIPERRAGCGVREIGNWVRNLIEGSESSLVVAMGTEAATIVRDSNPQLKRRMQACLSMPYFDIRSTKGRSEFRSLLAKLDDQLPLAEFSQISSEAIAPRLAIASNGILDYLMKLLLNAVSRAVEGQRESITMEDLERAFVDSHQIAAEGGNPFSCHHPGSLLDRAGQLFYADDKERRRHVRV